MRQRCNEKDSEKCFEELKEVQDYSWIYSEDFMNKDEDVAWTDNCWGALKGALERAEKLSERRRKNETSLRCLEGYDVFDLLFTKGQLNSFCPKLHLK